jgi:transcriptional regulator with XRE-family HTH domain
MLYLKEWREARQKSKRQVATLAGVSISRVTSIEAGADVDAEVVEALASALGIEPERLARPVNADAVDALRAVDLIAELSGYGDPSETERFCKVLASDDIVRAYRQAEQSDRSPFDLAELVYYLEQVADFVNTVADHVALLREGGEETTISDDPAVQD